LNSLKDLDAEVAMEVPQAAGEALKALALGAAGPEQQRAAYHFIVHHLAGVDRLGFALPGDSDVMAWRNGRRFVGLQIERIVAAPMDEVVSELPRARTITEQARRPRSPR
jgi:hypothetical protein